jgi:hypothetical protein
MTDRIVMSGIIASMAALIGTDGPPWPLNRGPSRGGRTGWGSKAMRAADADERRRKRQRAQKAARKAQRGQR